jgi:hypothetical protein
MSDSKKGEAEVGIGLLRSRIQAKNTNVYVPVKH